MAYNRGGVARSAKDASSLHIKLGRSQPFTRPLAVRTPIKEAPSSLSSSSLSLDLNASVDEKARQSYFIKDPEGENTHDETTVDVVTVPCPGGDPLRSWNRDGLMGRYFGAPSMRDAEGEKTSGSIAPSWVRQGIRREVNVARILLYRHPELNEETTLNNLADKLLEELRIVRGDGEKERPLVFIGHSIGGIIVKMALAKASRDSRYSDVLRDCYGVAFFATPHQGSSYFAMPSLATSIQSLLQLSQPLPTSITDDLRVGNGLLLHTDEDFKAIAYDLKVWTLYETIDSRLRSGPPSGSANAEEKSVYFTAPLASIKSAILGMRQERIFPLQSDHANAASFGRHNVHTLRLFLRQFATLIDQADASVKDDTEAQRWSLNLEQRVGVEVHGFFEDLKIGDETPVTRAWSTRLPLADFLRKGPENCLRDRLNEAEDVSEETRLVSRSRGRTMPNEEQKVYENEVAAAADEGLAIKNQQILPASPPLSPIIHPVDAGPMSASAPTIISTSAHHQRRLSSPIRGTTGLRRISSPTGQAVSIRRASPYIRADFDQDLAIDRLSPPPRPRSLMSIGRSTSDASRLEYRDFPPFSHHRSKSDADDVDDEDADDLPDGMASNQKTGLDSDDDEDAIADEVLMAFARPNVKSRKFVWVHLAYNNPAWVKKMIQTLQTCYRRDYSVLYDSDFWATKHAKGRHSQHYAYFAKPGCYIAATRPMTPRSHSISSPYASNFEDSNLICLFLPYLHFDSYKRLIRRRDLILRRLAHGRARPVPESVAKSDSLELQVIWEYLGHDPPLNCRRTLDQYGYPSLRDTRGRDDDQMLYKLTKEGRGIGDKGQSDMYSQWSGSRRANSNGSGGSWKDKLTGIDDSQNGDDRESEDEVLNGNVLMVDQMWLWVIHSHTILSFFPKRESDPIEGPLYQQADLRDSIFNEVNVDLTRQCENALDLAALSALHAVSVLFDRASHPDLEVFRIFEEAISVLTEKLTNSLKAFRTEGFRDKASDYEPVESKERSIRARHKEEGRRAEAENRDNTSALLELRDIEDELLVLLSLFDRQSAVLSSMLTAYSAPSLRDHTSHGRMFLSEAIKRVGEYRQKASEMTRRVRSTRDDYDKLLQMVQRQAQVDEVRLSRLHADLASAQSRSVMIFTIFTVIFLPLSFFTSLFGMNTREWTKGEGPPSLGFIGAVALPSSAVLISLALVGAWSIHARKFFQWVADVHRALVGWVWFLFCWPVIRTLDLGRWATRGGNGGRNGSSRASEGKREVLMRKLKQENSDFWARHRLERERGYQVPEVNRRGPTAAKRNLRQRG